MPKAECMSYPVIPDVDIAPLLGPAVMFPNDDPAFRVLINFARIAQAGPTSSAESDVSMATEDDCAAPDGSLSLAARPLPVPAADRDELGEGNRAWDG